MVCLASWVYGAGFQQTFVTESVLVTTDPLMALNVAVVVFLSIVLALRLAASMAWEREHRTLEVLLVAPAGWGAIIAGKFAAEVAVLIVTIAIYAVYLFLAQPLGQGVVGLYEIAGLAVIPLFGLPTLALALLVGAFARSVRAAVVLFLTLIILLTAFELALGVLNAVDPNDLSLFDLYLRASLEIAAPIVRPLSAMAELARPIEAVVAQAPITSAQSVWALALTFGTLVFADVAGRTRGAV